MIETRPDIAFTVPTLSRYVYVKEEHWKALKHLLRGKEGAGNTASATWVHCGAKAFASSKLSQQWTRDRGLHIRFIAKYASFIIVLALQPHTTSSLSPDDCNDIIEL